MVLVVVGSFFCASFAPFMNLAKVFTFMLMVLYSFLGRLTVAPLVY